MKEIPNIATLRIDVKEFNRHDSTKRNAIIYYYYLMSLYRKSIIYNWSYKRLSEITGLHRTTISGYIKFLKRYNFIEQQGNHLVLKIRRDEYAKTKVKKGLSWKEFKELFSIKLLKINIQQQEFIIRMKRIYQKKNSFVSRKEYKAFLKFYKKNKKKIKLEDKSNSVITHSTRSLAKLFKLSASTVGVLLKQWKKAKKIDYKEELSLIKENCSYDEYRLMLSSFNKNQLSFFPVYNDYSIFLHKGISISLLNTYGENISMYKKPTRHVK